MAEKKEDEKIEVVQIPLTTGNAYKLPNGEVLSGEELIGWMATQIWKIKKAVA